MGPGSCGHSPCLRHWRIDHSLIGCSVYLVINKNFNFRVFYFLVLCVFFYRGTSVELEMRANQLGSLLRFQYGSIRGWASALTRHLIEWDLLIQFFLVRCSGLTESRWADEVSRTVDSLFNIWLQATSTSKQQMHQEMNNSLANCFITSGQWLPLPTECQVITYLVYFIFLLG